MAQGRMCGTVNATVADSIHTRRSEILLLSSKEMKRSFEFHYSTYNASRIRRKINKYFISLIRNRTHNHTIHTVLKDIFRYII